MDYGISMDLLSVGEKYGPLVHILCYVGTWTLLYIFDHTNITAITKRTIKCGCFDVSMNYIIGWFWRRIASYYSIHSNFFYDLVNKLCLSKFEVSIFGFRKIDSQVILYVSTVLQIKIALALFGILKFSYSPFQKLWAWDQEASVIIIEKMTLPR